MGDWRTGIQFLMGVIDFVFPASCTVGNGSKRARHEDGYSFISNVKVKHARNYTSTPSYVMMA
jgi:hypothetical protein